MLIAHETVLIIVLRSSCQYYVPYLIYLLASCKNFLKLAVMSLTV